jgi:hypothetical protein
VSALAFLGLSELYYLSISLVFSNSSAMRSSKSYHCGTAGDNWLDDESSSEFDDEN